MSDEERLREALEALAALFEEASELGEHRFTFKTIALARRVLRAGPSTARLRETAAKWDAAPGEDCSMVAASSTHVEAGAECGYVGSRWVCVKARGHDHGHAYELRNAAPEALFPPKAAP